MLWRDLRAFQVYGANTNVGKTIVSTLLCKGLRRRAAPNGLLYLKPVSTGPADDADDRHIARFVPGVVSRCISQFSDPVSPHLAAQRYQGGEKMPQSDRSILAQIREVVSKHAGAGGRYAVLETAGGTLSPGPSGALQADLYRPLRLPTLLVGDSKLGGISTTISAFESLHIRGYDLTSITLFDDPSWGNADYLKGHFQKHEVPVFAIPPPPPKHDNSEADELALAEYYDTTSESPVVAKLLDLLHDTHFHRISKLTSLPTQAESIVWHPFRQHALPQELIAIDSAYHDHFEAYQPSTDQASASQSTGPLAGLQPALPSTKPVLTPLFDGSASWWTQGLGHGNTDLALAAAHAAGRYGHVMFANAVHEPALDLSYNLLSTLANPRLSRVFFTDNGSTAMEVAVKMALRASCVRYGWNKDEGEIGVLGLAGSYHGDTIGVMNCSEPNVFNEKVDWYKPWGYWFTPPEIKMRKGKWELVVPAEMTADGAVTITQFNSLDEVFIYQRRASDAARYENHIISTLTSLVQKHGRRFGALIMEPILMGAGGMIFVDPLFQRTLIKTIRSHPALVSPSHQSPETDPKSWSGLPVIADEVFTGLYRLGRASSFSFLSSTIPGTSSLDVAPDISAHAKLLTGGLLPLAITTASESIFRTFLSSDKKDALLHGHSYTAHAVGCTVANKSLKEIEKLDQGKEWESYKSAWSSASTSSPSVQDTSRASTTFSFFTPQFLHTLSMHPRISDCFALGTVLSMTLCHPPSSTADPSAASGYTSNLGSVLQSSLLGDLDGDGMGVHSRVLGDVLYLMTSLTTPPDTVERIQNAVLRCLG